MYVASICGGALASVDRSSRHSGIVSNPVWSWPVVSSRALCRRTRSGCGLTPVFSSSSSWVSSL